MMFPPNKGQRRKQSDMLPMRRVLSTPAVSIVYGDDTPETPEIKILSAINFNFDYMNSEYMINKQRIQKLNSIVEKYFTPTLSNMAPFSNDEWRNILQANTPKQTLKEKLYSSLKRGLPEEMRKDIWLYLAETQRLEREYQAQGITYETLKAQVCPNEDKIRKDVIRSFSELEFFKTHKPEKLAVVQNILQAYSNFDPEVGYTQGMNFFVGIIFSFLQPSRIPGKLFIYTFVYLTKDEEETDEEEATFVIDPKVEKDVFWIMVYIMKDMDWRMLYVNHTPKLQQLISKLDDRLRKKLPKVSRMMTEHTCLPACFAQYFLTILLFHSPPELAKRTLEVFFVVGEDILIHILIEALRYSEKKILDTEELADVFSFLRNNLLKAIGL